MKVLLTASILRHITLFHQQLINMLKSQGHIVHVAASGDMDEKNGFHLENVDRFYNINFKRNPFHLANISAYQQLHRLIDAENYDIIHCNTPAVGVLTRLAARPSRKKRGTRVIYTAHGFHFYNGAPLLNWLLYYPIERFMCRYTDTLVTINKEDTRLTQKHFAVRNFHMHGVGVDSNRFHPVTEEEKQSLRQQLRLKREYRLILCIGELNANKNQQVLIKAAALIAPTCPNLKILLAGTGENESRLRTLIQKLRMENYVSLLGYCTNIHQYIQTADLVVSCSFREGLAINIIEAALSGKPIVASSNRGHRELVLDGMSGFLVPPTNERIYADRITRLLNDDSLYLSMSRAAHARGQLYTINRVLPELERLYGMSLD